MALSRRSLAAPCRRAVYDATIRVQIRSMRAELRELKRRVNGLLWATATAIVIELAKELMK